MAFDVDFLSMMTNVVKYQGFVSLDGYAAPSVQPDAQATLVPAHIQYKTVIDYGDEEENQTSTAQLFIPPAGFIWFGANPATIPAGTVASPSNGGDITTIATWTTPSAGVLAVSSLTGLNETSGAAVIQTSTGVATISFTGVETVPFPALTGCTLLNGNGLIATGNPLDENTVPTVGTLDRFVLPDGVQRHVLWIAIYDDPSTSPSETQDHHQTIYLD